MGQVQWVLSGTLTPVRVNPESPSESPQKYLTRTIVGSVIRENDHPSHGNNCDPNKVNKKGQTGSFEMVLATTP